jgi:hypothetical protein
MDWKENLLEKWNLTRKHMESSLKTYWQNGIELEKI